MLSLYPHHKKFAANSLNLSEEADELITKLTERLSIDLGTTSDLAAFRTVIEKEILRICDVQLQEKILIK